MTFRAQALAAAVLFAAGVACDSSDDGSAVTAGSSSGGTQSPPIGVGGHATDKGGNGGGGSGSAGLDAAGSIGQSAGTAGEATGAAGAAESGGADQGGQAGEGGSSGVIDGEAGASGAAGGAAADPVTNAYVSTLFGDLLVCSLDPKSGAPGLLPSSPVDVQGFMHGVWVNHAGTFVYVLADPSRVDVYAIAADGTLPEQPSATTTVDDDNALLTLTLDPMDRFAHVGSPFSNLIYSFEIEPLTGALVAVGEPLQVGPAAHPRSPSYVAADPSGNFVYVSQQADPDAVATDQGVRGYRVNQTTGALTELPDSPFGGVGIFAGAIAFRPDGKFLYTSGGGLRAFAINRDTGKLTLVEGSPFTQDVGSDPWATNIAVSPQGDFVYVSRFFVTNHVSGFAIDPVSGVLEEVPGSPVTGLAPYSIAIEPSGRFLYVGEDTGQTSVFSLSRASGALTEIEHSPFAFGGLEPELAFVTLK
jgi:6-phosphogluconolactonase